MPSLQMLSSSSSSSSSTPLSSRFVETLAKQRIFEEYYKPLGSSTLGPSPKGTKIATRNNTDLFLAQHNVIRCCSTIDSSGTFKLLDIDTDFAIKALEINSLGSLMAAVGDSKITVVVLPAQGSIAGNATAVIDCRNYLIDLGDCSITKVLWQALAPHDCVLVVLTSNNTILTFDVSISTTTFQKKVELSKYGIKAESIAFGAINDNLMGMLTLYVATVNEVYAIYPFLHSPDTAHIAVSPELVDEYYADCKILTDTIDQEFPTYDALVSVEYSSLKRSLLRQLAFAKRIHNKLHSNSIEQTEFRPNSELLSIVSTELPSGEIALQGPLFTFAGQLRIFDLQHLQANLKFSSLAALSVSQSGTLSVYILSQLTYLLMKWSEDEATSGKLQEPKPVSFKSVSNTPTKYHKPKRGFGIIEDEPIVASELEKLAYESELRVYNARKQEYDSIQKQNKYWKNSVTVLTKLSDTVVFSSVRTQTEPSFIISPSNQNLLCIATEKKCCLVDTSPVIDSVFASFQSGSLPKLGDKSPRFQLLDGASFTSNSAIVTDPMESYYYISSTNQKLAITKCHIIGSVKEIVSSSEQLQLEIKDEENDIALTSELSLDPVDQLVAEISQLKVGLRADSSKDQRLDPADLESFKLLNRLSNDVYEKISQFTEYLLRLDQRMNTQASILRKEVELAYGLTGQTISVEKQDSNARRLAKLSERQTKAREAFSLLNAKVAQALTKVQRRKALVPSEAEIKWFKELNRLTALLSNSEDSLHQKIELLSSQVKTITATAKGKADKEEKNVAYTEIAQGFQHSRELTKIQYELLRIGDRLSCLKTDSTDFLRQEEQAKEVL